MSAPKPQEYPQPLIGTPHPETTRRWRMAVQLAAFVAVLALVGHVISEIREASTMKTVIEARGDPLRAKCATSPPTANISDWGRTCVAVAAQYPYQERERSSYDPLPIQTEEGAANGQQ